MRFSLLFAFSQALIVKIMAFSFLLSRLVRHFSYLHFYFFTSVLLLVTTDVSANTEQLRRLRPSVDEQTVVEVTNPSIHNPIAPSEKNRGKQIADTSIKVRSSKQNANGRLKPRGLEALENVQTLYVEHHDEGKNADPKSRKADVVYYDYSKNQAIKVVVDLNNNTVQDTVIKQGVNNQPYFTKPEISAAMQMIFNHPQMGPYLRKAYQEVTGQILNDVSQLVAQGGVYFPDNRSKLGILAADCESDRCMQLFIPIDDTHFIDATNVVVNLSSGEILWVKQGIFGHSH